MNGLLLVVGAIFLVSFIVGCKRGFIKIVASLVATIVTIALVVFFTPYVSGIIRNVTPLEEKMQEKCIDMLIPDGADSEQMLQQELPLEHQISLIEESKLPEIFREMLLENNNDEVYKSLGVTTFGEYVGTYLAKIISDIIAFLITLLVVTILIRVLLAILGVISKLPVIGGVNRLAGGIVGAGMGLVAVWILFLVITVFYDNAISQACLEHIGENKILQVLYDSNLLMKYIVKF